MKSHRNSKQVSVAARRVLLDALEALGPHRKAVVLVGAQAIYLHVGEGDMAVAPFTTDGDLAINPSVLDDEPILAEALRAAGFDLAVNPGTWSLNDVQIDLLVPSSLGGPGRRSARLGPHGTEVARYDEAVTLAVDLRDLASRDGTTAGFAKRFEALRKSLVVRGNRHRPAVVRR